MGDVEGRLQNMQVNLAARRLIMDARGVQEYNMFDKGDGGFYFAAMHVEGVEVSILLSSFKEVLWIMEV